MAEPQRMYGYKEAAALIGVESATLRKMIREGRFPKPHRAGGLIRWFAFEIHAWQMQYTLGQLPEPPPRKKK